MILITGSSGYIGSEIVNEFEKRNIKYIGIDNQSYEHKILFFVFTKQPFGEIYGCF